MKAYKVIKSNIHREGLCAARNIKIGERVIEYRGKKITHKQADEDTKYGYDITYLFTLDKKYLLDGDFEFNKARLIIIHVILIVRFLMKVNQKYGSPQ